MLPAFRVFPALTLALACAASAGAAQTSIVSFKDNTLYQNNQGSLSNGSGEHFFVGKPGPFASNVRRGLLAFDIASMVPAGATITGVELRLNLSMTISTDVTLELHRLLTDWGEGASDAPGEEGPGDTPQAGDATWIHTFYSDQFWTNPGGDFDATISASTVVGSEFGYYYWSSAQMVADVQNWLDNPSSNFGWILMGGEQTSQSAKRFDTHEHENIDYRPTLFITYVPAPGALALLGLGALGRRRRRD